MKMSNDAVKRGVDPYGDADWVRAKFNSSAKERVNFTIAQAQLSAGTSYEIIATANGFITGLYATVVVGIGTGGTITVEVGGTTVTGLAVIFPNSAAKGTRRQDTIDHGVLTARVREGDRIEIVPGAVFSGSGSVNGTLVIDLD